MDQYQTSSKPVPGKQLLNSKKGDLIRIAIKLGMGPPTNVIHRVSTSTHMLTKKRSTTKHSADSADDLFPFGISEGKLEYRSLIAARESFHIYIQGVQYNLTTLNQLWSLDDKIFYILELKKSRNYADLARRWINFQASTKLGKGYIEELIENKLRELNLIVTV